MSRRRYMKMVVYYDFVKRIRQTEQDRLNKTD